MQDDQVLSPDEVFKVSGSDMNDLLTRYRKALTRLHSEEVLLPGAADAILKALVVDYLKRV